MGFNHLRYINDIIDGMVIKNEGKEICFEIVLKKDMLRKK